MLSSPQMHTPTMHHGQQVIAVSSAGDAKDFNGKVRNNTGPPYSNQR